MLSSKPTTTTAKFDSLMQVIVNHGTEIPKTATNITPATTSVRTPPDVSKDNEPPTFRGNFQHTKLLFNGKVQNFLVPLDAKPGAPRVAYGPFDFSSGQVLTPSQTHVSQSNPIGTIAPRTTPSQPHVSQSNPIGTIAPRTTPSQPHVTQSNTNGTLAQRTTPVILSNCRSSIASAKNTATNNVVHVVNPNTITSTATTTTDKSPLTVTNYSRASASSSLQYLGSVVSGANRTQRSLLTQSLAKRTGAVANTSPSQMLNVMDARTSNPREASQPPVKHVSIAPSASRNLATEAGGVLVKEQNTLTYISNGSSTGPSLLPNAGNTNPGDKFVIVKDSQGRIVNIKRMVFPDAKCVQGQSTPYVSGTPAITIVSPSAARQPRPPLPKTAAVGVVDDTSRPLLKIDSVFSLAESEFASEPDCAKPVDASLKVTPPTVETSEQPAFVEVLEVTPCKVVMRNISRHFTDTNKQNDRGNFNIRKRPWSKFVREHLSSYYRRKKIAKSELTTNCVYRVLQDSPLTVAAIPTKEEKDKSEDEDVQVNLNRRPQTARKRGYGRVNRGRIAKKVKLEVQEEPRSSSVCTAGTAASISHARPLLMSALSSDSPPLPPPLPTPVATLSASPPFLRSLIRPGVTLSSNAVTTKPAVQEPVRLGYLPSVVKDPVAQVRPAAQVQEPIRLGNLPSVRLVKETVSQVKPAAQVKEPVRLGHLPSVQIVKDPVAQVCPDEPEKLSDNVSPTSTTTCKSLPLLGPCVTAGLTGKAVLPGREGTDPENYLILRTSKSCYFVPVGKSAYVVPISKAGEIVQSCKRPIPSIAEMPKGASETSKELGPRGMPVLTAETGAPKLHVNSTAPPPHLTKVATTNAGPPACDSEVTQSALSKCISALNVNPFGQKKDVTSKPTNGTQRNSLEKNDDFASINCNIKPEPITYGYPGDPDPGPPVISPAPSPEPMFHIRTMKTEEDSDTDDAWTVTEFPDWYEETEKENMEKEEEATAPIKSVADLYRSQQSYQPPVASQDSDDDDSGGRQDNIERLRQLLKSKQKKVEKARETWSGKDTEKLIKEFDDI